jgi:hypothetical protein
VWISTVLFAGAVAGLVAAITVMFRGANLPGDKPIAQQRPDQPAAPAIPDARLVRVFESVWSGEAKSPAVGDEFAAGRKLVLHSGVAEFVFGDGAHAIVEGPAVFEVSTSSSARLTGGKCAVTAEGPSAHGFAIHAPGMSYTDLGTEFGVLITANGDQEMHVFRGKVQAERRKGQGANGVRSSLIVSANEAIRVPELDASGKSVKPIEHIAVDEKQFVRVVREPFPLYSTGVGLARGDADPHWQLVAVSTDPEFKPQPAIVADPTDKYFADSRERAQWVANNKDHSFMPNGCRWTFRTQFDLSGFDPSTARIAGRIGADDFVVGVRLNGVELPPPVGATQEDLFIKGLDLTMEKGFVPGVNTVEIVVENNVVLPAVSPPNNNMGFYLEWHGEAQRRERP